MWSFPINNDNNSGDDGNSSGSVTIAQEVPPSACSIQCEMYQKALVDCVDSIRAVNSNSSNSTSNSRNSSNDNDEDDEVVDNSKAEESSKVESPTCLPVAVSEWTKCCTEANLRDRKEHEEEGEGEGTTSGCRKLIRKLTM